MNLPISLAYHPEREDYFSDYHSNRADSTSRLTNEQHRYHFEELHDIRPVRDLLITMAPTLRRLMFDASRWKNTFYSRFSAYLVIREAFKALVRLEELVWVEDGPSTNALFDPRCFSSINWPNLRRLTIYNDDLIWEWSNIE